METHKLKLTTAAIRPHLGKTCILWDTQQPGLGLSIRPSSESFILRRRFRGKSLKLTIGRLGAWTPEQARREARALVAKLDQGIDPREEKRKTEARGTTLREAMGWHLEAMKAKDCSPRPMADVERELERHLKDWVGRPLVEITTDDCVARHRKITRRGPYVANRVFRNFRAIWETADKRRDLPRCPVRAVTFNKERRRREPIEWDRLPGWWAKVEALKNPVIRDLQVFLLFTGLRRTDACTVKWSELDLAAGTMHRPQTKGGIDRAFTVPICDHVRDLLRRRRVENAKLPHGEGLSG